jgi:hypothetical protein
VLQLARTSEGKCKHAEIHWRYAHRARHDVRSRISGHHAQEQAEVTMGWFFRKSFRLLPGIRVNLSKSGPRLSVGIPGARASVGVNGKARIFGGKGPLRYQKALNLGSSNEGMGSRVTGGFLSLIKKLLGGS